MTPSCIKAMAETAGFRVEEEHALHPFARVFLCRTVAQVPDELRSSAWDSAKAAPYARRLEESAKRRST
jgi:hypothetical protein